MALTQKEISARFYRRRKEQGLCPRCGKKLDRVGHYCTECKEQHTAYRRECKKFFRELGLCPVCGKEKLFGTEKQCIACRQKAYERRKPLTDEQKQKASEAFKKQQKSLYKERVELGVCTRCGKRKAAVGRKKCEICLEKNAKFHRDKRAKEEKRMSVKQYRKDNNLCFFCGKPNMAKRNICEECFKRCQENGRRNARKSQWRCDDKIVFKRF